MDAPEEPVPARGTGAPGRQPLRDRPAVHSGLTCVSALGSDSATPRSVLVVGSRDRDPALRLGTGVSTASVLTGDSAAEPAEPLAGRAPVDLLVVCAEVAAGLPAGQLAVLPAPEGHLVLAVDPGGGGAAHEAPLALQEAGFVAVGPVVLAAGAGVVHAAPGGEAADADEAARRVLEELAGAGDALSTARGEVEVLRRDSAAWRSRPTEGLGREQEGLEREDALLHELNQARALERLLRRRGDEARRELGVEQRRAEQQVQWLTEQQARLQAERAAAHERQRRAERRLRQLEASRAGQLSRQVARLRRRAAPGRRAGGLRRRVDALRRGPGGRG